LVERGIIISIKGGADAKQIHSTLKIIDAPDMYQIAEIEIGLNPFSRMCSVIIDDKVSYGTVHIGIGQNIFMGRRQPFGSIISLIILRK
jgi:2,5-dihydroxypyridine 5,6-dioxygenase